jgi:hypothetical protein
VSTNNLNNASGIPSELECSVPRRVRLSGMGIVYCAVAAAGTVFGVVMAAYYWSTSLPMAGFFLLFMFGFAAIYFSAVWGQRRLLSRGAVAQGIVTGCEKGSRGRKTGYFLVYDFSLPDGGRCQGKEFRGQPMAEGVAVTVLSDAHQPRRNRLYPISLVRIATP